MNGHVMNLVISVAKGATRVQFILVPLVRGSTLIKYDTSGLLLPAEVASWLESRVTPTSS